jgi:hypothetical protein
LARATDDQNAKTHAQPFTGYNTGGLFKPDSVASYYPDRSQSKDRTIGEKWQRHADHRKDPEHHGEA